MSAAEARAEEFEYYECLAVQRRYLEGAKQRACDRLSLAIYGHVVGNRQRDAVEHRSARIEKFAVN